MISLPLPVFVSFVLCFILVRGLRTGVAKPILTLLGLCALQAAIASFNILFDVPLVRIAQILLASMIGPVTWVAYLTTTHRAFDPKRDAIHLGAGPLIVLALGTIDPLLWDGFLTLWFAGHGIMLWLSVRSGSDTLPNVPFEAAEGARRLWIGAAVVLLVTALVDLVIILSVISGFSDWVPWIVTSSSAVILLCLAAIGLAQPQTAQIEQTPTIEPKPIDEETSALFDRATALLEAEKLYLDPDLNLTRLARRLHVPVKKLSTAINQSTGENVSRLINGYRINAVCAALRDGNMSITQAMFAAGFSTKSNFNTEFSRVMQQSPRDWLAKSRSDTTSQC